MDRFPGRGRGGGSQFRQRRLTVFLPVTRDDVEAHRDRGAALPSWRQLPFNPFILPAPRHQQQQQRGSTAAHYSSSSSSATRASHAPTATTGAHPQEQQHQQSQVVLHCDPCQKDFRTQEAYAAHMARHMYCAVPGCNFTCKADKEWKMEAHMDLLHNRPDAPALADPVRYLEQRRARFPTRGNVSQKVEELYYKAARGLVMPDERRRWMRQHGILIGKRPRSEASFIARGVLPGAEDSEVELEGEGEGGHPSAAASRSPSESSRSSFSGSSASDGDGEREDYGEGRSSPTLHTETAVATSASIAVPKSAIARYEQQRRRQEEEGDGGTRVPRAYTCARCGARGQHWADRCPAPAADGQQQQQGTREVEGCGGSAVTEEEVEVNANINSTIEDEDEDDDGPPPVMTARGGEGPVREATRVLAPVAAARLAAALGGRGGRGCGRGGIGGCGRGRGAGPVSLPPPPSLYEKLTEEDRLTESGLLLQAIRFFVARDFFQPQQQ